MECGNSNSNFKVIDNLNSTSAANALSAKQDKELGEKNAAKGNKVDLDSTDNNLTLNENTVTEHLAEKMRN